MREELIGVVRIKSRALPKGKTRLQHQKLHPFCCRNSPARLFVCATINKINCCVTGICSASAAWTLVAHVPPVEERKGEPRYIGRLGVATKR